MSDFTILWTHEAEDWLQDQRKSSIEYGYTFNEGVIYTPSNEEKKAIETELYILSGVLMKFANDLIKLEKESNHEASIKLSLNAPACKGGFYVNFWYEPGYNATNFMIYNYSNDTETARIMFEDIASFDYSVRPDYE